MQIFKAFMKVAKKLLPGLTTYIVIFLVIMLLMSSLANQPVAQFETTKLSVVVLDEDNSQASKALTDYIASIHEIEELPAYDVQTLEDNLYYQNIDYVLTIKDGYEEKIKSGTTDGLFTNATSPQSFSAEYISVQLDQYVQTLKAYLEGGFSFDEAAEKTAAAVKVSTETETVSFGEENTGLTNKTYYYYLYMPYIIPAILLSVLSRIIITLNKKDLRNRTSCSPVSSSKYNLQVILGSVLLCVAVWLLFIVILAFFSGGEIFSEMGLYATLNSLIYLMISAGIAVLVSLLLHNNVNVVEMISNVLVLGMSFLCGIFVPLAYLGENVVAIARFLPAYWYVRAINMIGGVEGAVFNAGEMYTFLGVECLFAAAIFAVCFLIGKLRRS